LTSIASHPRGAGQIASCRRDGFIELKDVCNVDELRHYGREITRLTIELNTQTRPLEARNTTTARSCRW
jgi:hypothetical protein